MGFSHCVYDRSLFICHRGNDMDYIFLYVDDIIPTTSSESLCETIMSHLNLP